MSSFAEILQLCIDEVKSGQRALARSSGKISQSTLSRILAGNNLPTLEQFQTILKPLLKGHFPLPDELREQLEQSFYEHLAEKALDGILTNRFGPLRNIFGCVEARDLLRNHLKNESHLVTDVVSNVEKAMVARHMLRSLDNTGTWTLTNEFLALLRYLFRYYDDIDTEGTYKILRAVPSLRDGRRLLFAAVATLALRGDSYSSQRLLKHVQRVGTSFLNRNQILYYGSSEKAILGLSRMVEEPPEGMAPEYIEAMKISLGSLKLQYSSE